MTNDSSQNGEQQQNPQGTSSTPVRSKQGESKVQPAASTTQPQITVSHPSTPPTQTSPLPSPISTASTSSQKELEGTLLFHFGECTNCHHLLPISTTTEKYFPILSKDPNKPTGLGEKCARCGADSWILVTV